MSASRDSGRRRAPARTSTGRRSVKAPARTTTRSTTRSTTRTLRERLPTPLQLARLLRAAALEKKAWHPVVLDVRNQTTIADYFVICEGETDRQVRAIADAMQDAAHVRKQSALAVDGYQDAGWVLLDFDSVMAHVFLPGERTFYDLEGLWTAAAKRSKRARQS